MGLFDKLKDALTETVEEPVDKPKRGIKNLFFEEVDTSKKKRGMKDIFFEEVGSGEPKRSLRDIFLEEEKGADVEFVDSQELESASGTIKGKLQDKNRELKMLGLAINTIEIKDFPESGDVIREYLALLEEQKRLSELASKVSDEDIMGQVTLERKYDEFERRYEAKIPRIKSLYYLREMRRQNSDMKRAFSGKAGEISNGQINGYVEYIRLISEQKGAFHSQYVELLNNELVIAEYRLKMLMLMRDISRCEESRTNPFSRDSKVKKDKFGEIFLEDFAESSKQYELMNSRRKRYVSAQVLDERTFDEIDKMVDELGVKMNNKVVDDFSISEVFDNSGYDILKTFVRLKIKMNEIDFRYDEVKDIENKQYDEKRRKKAPDFDDDDDGWRL